MDRRSFLKNSALGGGAAAATSLAAPAIAQGNVTLIAATKIEIDADATNFITSTQPANFDALMKVHNASVQSAIESRRAVVELIKSLASGVV